MYYENDANTDATRDTCGILLLVRKRVLVVETSPSTLSAMRYGNSVKLAGLGVTPRRLFSMLR